jgi:phosphoribosylanthranilate isomerase
MRDAANIRDLVTLQPDYVGFIFYKPSKRYIGEDFDEKIMGIVPENIRKVGVFVNESLDKVLELARKYQLDYVQLHGNENIEYCEQLKNNKVGVIKAFSISNSADLKEVTNYQDCCDYVLFDTKVEGYGGGGRKFDWSIVHEYKGIKPFFLSGGIDENDAQTIKKIEHPYLFAIDINSRFETAPALKNILKISNFIGSLNDNATSINRS